MSTFSLVRFRRLRQTPQIRSLVRENKVTVNNLVYPLFVISGHGKCRELPSMPGIFQYSIDLLPGEVDEISKLNIPAVLLFGVPENKDDHGSNASDANGVVQEAIRVVKKRSPLVLVISDVCLCSYTTHGHCGIIENGQVDNDKTIDVISEIALSHARAGADLVAPSDMMDGRVLAIRKKLDANNFSHIPIISYAAKYASAFYGPFREAADCKPHFGDRSSYQMDPANLREALREVHQDVCEGADIIMIKPALPYLDVIRKVRDTCDNPLAAYNVSGEYSMIKAASQNGWIDEKKAVTELLTSIKRAGADFIITYHAKDFAKWSLELVDPREK